MKNLLALLLVSMASSVGAVCPGNVLIEQGLDQNYEKLKSAKLQSEAQAVVGKLWELWTKAPDDKAQQLLNSGMSRMRQGDLRKAETELTKLINYCPNYSEGYNQRAFTRYLAFDFENALPDLIRALELRPRHLGALSGKGLTHKAMGQELEAEIEFRKALSLNPFMPERNMIPNVGVDL
jgi:tetratricopeptide (TPR) repeat protein